MRTSPDSPTSDSDLATLLQGLLGPTPAPRMWAVSYDGPGSRIFVTPEHAARFITDETRRRVIAGRPIALTVSSLDKGMAPMTDISAEVFDALVNTSWAVQAADRSYAIAYLLRDQVLDVVERVLVSAKP